MGTSRRSPALTWVKALTVEVEMDGTSPAFALPSDNTATARRPQVAAHGSCSGTLGELFQGPIERGGQVEIAIVSLPFAGRSTCRYILQPDAHSPFGEGLENRPKTTRALELLISQHRLRLPSGRWVFSSDLEVGKGMASSTADIVAAIRCVGQILGRRFRTHDVMNVLRHVERSDSVFLEEAALYLSERHEIVVRFGRSLGYTAAYLVEPNVVDTEAMRDCLVNHYLRHETEYRALLDLFVSAAARKDPFLVAQAATESARLSQRCLPKRRFSALRSAMRSLAADGLFVAHTGSVAGYLYVRPPTPSQRAEITAFFSSLGERVRFDPVGWFDACA